MPRRPPASIRRFIAEAAIDRANVLPTEERALLFDAISFLLDGDEAESARMVAYGLRETERHQMKLTKLLVEARK